MQRRRLDTMRFLDDRSEVKTSSASQSLSFYEKHTDPIPSSANVEEETPEVACWLPKKTKNSSGLVMVIGEHRRE
jgi:hypothetical protein